MMRKVLIILIAIFVPAFAKAQCAMCRAVIETSGDNATAQGLNNGITYLMIFPYLLVGAIIYLIYRNTQRANQESEN